MYCAMRFSDLANYNNESNLMLRYGSQRMWSLFNLCDKIYVHVVVFNEV